MEDSSVEDSHAKFVQALTKSQSRLYAYILTLHPNHDAASDILQNTNMVLWKKMDQFEPDSSFAAWSSSVAYYEVLAYRKKKSRDKHLFNDAVLELVAQSAAEVSEDNADRLSALRKCLGKLTAAQREQIRQRYHSGGSISDMSLSSNKSETAIYQALYRLRRRLADCINNSLARNPQT